MEVRLIDANSLIDRVERYISVAGKDKIVQMICEEPTAVGWISVEDRIPDNEDYVIAAYESGKVGRDFYSNIRKDFAFQHGGKVTHWMPMPPAPVHKEPFVMRDGDNFVVLGQVKPRTER